jgi:phosphoglycolate phosphatase-like HAD superfamily hydrolase
VQSGPHFLFGEFLKTPGIIFDLDGTLVDSVYQHVASWHETLRMARLAVPQWRIHRAIGMGGSLFLPKLLRDEGSDTRKRSSPGSKPHTKNFLTA